MVGIFFPKMFNFFNKKLENENGIKNALLVQVINAFVIGVIYILLPLLMLERKISVESMGLIFAILPLVTQSNRLLFGIASDYIGRKKFYWLNGLMNVVFLVTYYLAKSPFGFLLGKVGEGLRDASLWSVNRPYFMDHSQEKEKILIKLRGINSVFEALGVLSAGFLLTYLYYNKTLILLMALSLLIFPCLKSLKDKKKGKINLEVVLQALDFRQKSKNFKVFVAAFFLLGFAWGFTGGYILPLFLKEAGMAIENIGIFLGIRMFLSGIFAYVFHSLWSGKKKILVGGLLIALFLIMLPFSSPLILPLLIILTGMASGIAIAGRETIFTAITDHNTLGRDIGILMIGAHVGMSITQACSGFMITWLGFSSIFFASAGFEILFSWIAYYQF